MKKLFKLFINCSLMAAAPLAAQAAGTYYNGGYQSPQQGYGAPSGYARQQGYSQNSGYSNPGTYSNAGYSRYGQQVQANGRQPQQQKAPGQSSGAKTGFYLDGGISRETAMWEFSMKEAGSVLHYDNVSWNVFDAKAGYVFDAGSTAMQIDAGIKVGMQSGESSMIDDDITKGGYFITQWVDGQGTAIGNQIGHALSAGKSSGGSIFGFNVALGLTDFFAMGKTKITPSIGYRHFSYKLSTSKNYGLSVDTSQCFEINGETQCDPAIVVIYDDAGKTQQILWRDDYKNLMEIVNNGAKWVDSQGTYYFQQPGTSHSYEVAWSGPYAALDMLYEINQNNSVDARLELGLPGYTATGDQPYRFDWMHPKSIEDKAGIGSAMHLGLGANWKTALTDTVMLSVGLTYDYYSVSGADASTYLNGGYYSNLYNQYLTEWATANPGKPSEADMLDPTNGDPRAQNVKKLQQDCPGWVCTSGSEIESFYKSMGIRVGINARF
jgi:hypothetical protein